MKERPILFSGPMVRALLDGRKTQTRRIIKPQPEISPDLEAEMREMVKGTPNENCSLGQLITGAWHAGEDPDCPYGHHGDRLWVKETFFDHNVPMGKQNTTHVWNIEYVEYRASEWDGFEEGGQWKPSIHMPRRLSRIALEIESIRVERLNDIGEEDAKAEGIFLNRNDVWHWSDDSAMGGNDPISAYRSLWESINGPGSWSANPWVWVVTFKRVEDHRHGN